MLGTHAVVSMSLSEAGDLLAVLSNSTAYAYQPGMETWMCVVDSAFAQTSYSSIMTSGMPGKKESLHNAKEPRTHLRITSPCHTLRYTELSSEMSHCP